MPGPRAALRLASLALVAAIVAPTGASAQASLRTVDTLPCAEVQRGVQATGRYEKKTGFGSIPIMGVLSVPKGGSASCPPRSSPSFFIERTRDVPACVVGYSCERRGPRG